MFRVNLCVIHSLVLGHVQAHELRQLPDVGRQPLQLVVIEPQLLQGGQPTEVDGQHLDLVVAQIEALQFGQLADGGGQCAQQVLAQLQRFELCEAGRANGTRD